MAHTNRRPRPRSYRVPPPRFPPPCRGTRGSRGRSSKRPSRSSTSARPVQLSLIALLHFISDEQGAHALVAALKDTLAPGSQLVVTQAGFKRVDEADERYRAGRITLALRPREEIARFFEGFTFVEPGLVGRDHWRPELGDLPDKLLDTATLPFWVGVARKP
ncbi:MULTISPECIES: SAM-dependent methyltransferase [unclassified Streptomyces]|uniref:SAM-dependent methyltransferase n=1 Tax=unclassified Streptomyces TaxID=2593676 RepID=UPI0009985C12|nr:SAM-dependent methyltransferase [Streptomyces sp. SPB78]